MRATSAAFVLILALVPRASDNYADILAEYDSGNQTAALERLATLSPQTIDDGFGLLLTRLSAALGQTAAAMHTEAALRPLTLTSPRSSAHHLDLATQLIEKGQAIKGRLARPLPKSPLWPVTGEFRRLWYVTVITALEGTGQLGPATKYADQARELYPKDADVLLLSAIGEEMRASARTEGLADGDRHKSLEHAERYLRDAVAANPDRLEAQLRLGRVLYLRHDPAAGDVPAARRRCAGCAAPLSFGLVSWRRLRCAAGRAIGADLVCESRQGHAGRSGGSPRPVRIALSRR